MDNTTYQPLYKHPHPLLTLFVPGNKCSSFFTVPDWLDVRKKVRVSVEMAPQTFSRGTTQWEFYLVCIPDDKATFVPENYEEVNLAKTVENVGGDLEVYQVEFEIDASDWREGDMVGFCLHRSEQNSWMGVHRMVDFEILGPVKHKHTPVGALYEEEVTPLKS